MHLRRHASLCAPLMIAEQASVLGQQGIRCSAHAASCCEQQTAKIRLRAWPTPNSCPATNNRQQAPTSAASPHIYTCVCMCWPPQDGAAVCAQGSARLQGEGAHTRAGQDHDQQDHARPCAHIVQRPCLMWCHPWCHPPLPSPIWPIAFTVHTQPHPSGLKCPPLLNSIGFPTASC